MLILDVSTILLLITTYNFKSCFQAGVVCKLHTRCTVLAAMNPKCGVDLSQPFGMNVNMASPLLSRFDIVLHLRDKINNDWDDLVAEYVLNGEIFEDCKKDSPVWNLEMLQVFINFYLSSF